jgi:hypothetical protein
MNNALSFFAFGLMVLLCPAYLLGSILYEKQKLVQGNGT